MALDEALHIMEAIAAPPTMGNEFGVHIALERDLPHTVLLIWRLHLNPVQS